MHVAQVLPSIVPAGAPETKSEHAITEAAQKITASSSASASHIGPHFFDRNDHVTITNGTETREMKYKKAEPLLAAGGWRVVE